MNQGWSPAVVLFCVISVVNVEPFGTLLLSVPQSSINDGADFKAVADAMKVIGFTAEEIQTVYKILATILHLVSPKRKTCLCCSEVWINTQGFLLLVMRKLFWGFFYIKLQYVFIPN